jgi:hypothetical protein
VIDFHLLFETAAEWLLTVLSVVISMFKTSAHLRLENLALRQQLAVLHRSAPRRLKLTPADRMFWAWLRRVWGDWKSVLMIVKADTVVAWQRKGFRLFLDVENSPGKARSSLRAAGGSESDPRRSPQIRPMVVTPKPANEKRNQDKS